ncbi:Uncharacterised protein [Pseudomonas chlororaphis]|uniref:Uncharacterized protein n=1 Tax=Pseudomonas chlororaphis TaxID=587753 RepID=A0AAX3FX44_9PSED|nr:Uncharacterised protein [Pseudomonas chlororaphis]
MFILPWVELNYTSLFAGWNEQPGNQNFRCHIQHKSNQRDCYNP